MSVIVFPSIDSSPVIEGNSESPVFGEPTITSNFENGDIELRSTIDDPKKHLVLSYRNVSVTDLETLITFFRDTLCGGSLAFYYSLPVTSYIGHYIFSTPPKFIRVNSIEKLWNVTISIERIGFLEYTVSVGDYSEGTYGSGDYGY